MTYFSKSLVVCLLCAIGVFVGANSLLAGTITDQHQVIISAQVEDEDEKDDEVTESGGGASASYVPPITDTLPPIALNERPGVCAGIVDLNCDTSVDLTDFSILLYWMGKDDIPTYVDLRPDGVIDIYDFSILAYHWSV